MTGPVRVLLVSHVFPRHADDHVAPFLLRYARGLQHAGAQVQVLAPHQVGLPDHHDVGGIEVRRVRYGPDRRETIAYQGEMHRLARTPSGALQVVRLLWAFWRAIRRADRRDAADVIEVHWLVPLAVPAILARPRTPVRILVHGTDLAIARSLAPVRRLARWLARRADQVVAVSEPMADELADVLRRRADVVAPMPLDVPDRSEPAPGRDHIVAVGRLVPEKGHVDLVRAVATVQRSVPGVSLTIVGEGPERARLADEARTLGVTLHLPGAVGPHELSQRYLDADVVCVPSHREGFGLVAAEALAHGRAVVATDAGGLRDTVREVDGSWTGWRVPVSDPDALAAALVDALTRPDEARRRARHGRQHVTDRWSPERLGQEAHDQLRALVGPR